MSGAWRSKSAAAAKTGAPAAPAPAKPAPAKGAKPAVEPGSQPVDERMLFVASVLIGYTVQVQVRARPPSAALPC